MVHKLIEFALSNPLIVLLMTLGLIVFGGVAFVSVNVEAYPDPAPAIIEVIAKYPGASAEEVERQVTIPLEVALAGMPGLQYTRSKSLFGLAHLRNQFDYGVDFQKARQEVINRLQFVSGLPEGVGADLSPQSPTGEILRYTLSNPRDADDQSLYTLSDLKAVQDWVLEREFRRVPRIIDVVSYGGMIKRYEVQPDPDRLMKFGITLDQVEAAVKQSNANVGGDYLTQGDVVLNVRAIGLIGSGIDPARSRAVMGAEFPIDAADYLRKQEQRRLQRLRQIVIAAVDNVPIRVDDIVDGGPTLPSTAIEERQGVIVGNVPRLGRVSISRPLLDDHKEPLLDGQGHRQWKFEPEKVQGIVLLRKGEPTMPALEKLEGKVHELNDQAHETMLPGVKIEPYYDRADLIHVTTETVHENLFVGVSLVSVILLMFLSNVRCALIVALNIPLALLFAFAVLYARNKSANLLSIGAVDFGIIVDSSVIIVENIYRHLSSGEWSDLPLRERIRKACGEVEHALFFTTAIIVCAFLPLFTMQGPEGQIFGPMADTYAFALLGALLLALTVAPVLCLLFLRDLQPKPDNFLVAFLKRGYLRRLELCLKHRHLTLLIFAGLTIGTCALLPFMGREFMPELEEGNLWVRATFPMNTGLDEAIRQSDVAREVMQQFPEIELIVGQNGRPDDGTDPTGFYNVEFFLPLLAPAKWPAVVEETGWRRWVFGKFRPRTKPELIADVDEALSKRLVGVNWNYSQNIRDNVMESLSGVKGDNSIKIFGPDLNELENVANQVESILRSIRGVENVGVFRVMGQPNLEIAVDPVKCSQWGVTVDDVEDVVQTAVGGRSLSTMIEGEKRFDITLRWPQPLRDSEQAILNIPVEIRNNKTSSGDVASTAATPVSGAATGVAATGAAQQMPAITGNRYDATFSNIDSIPRRRLADFVTPLNERGNFDPKGTFVRAGASTIFREQGKRFIAVKFSVRGRDLASAVAEARGKVSPLFKSPYRAEWCGEFQEMEEAERRLLVIVPLSLFLIFVLLYIAFHSLIDASVVLSNVIQLCMGGVWGLMLTGTNFSISAAVGFVSLFGVAIMDGLLLISYFNQLRASGMNVHDAIMTGAERRMRPVLMTALTAILGLLPAALSTKIGAQTQRPLAIVVVSGMIATVFLTRYLMPVIYSYYGHREPPAGSGGLAH